MALVPAVDHLEERFLQFARDRAAAAGADLAPVDFADRRDFGGGAGEEGLVGDVQVVAGDAPRRDRVAQLRGERDHAVARDAHQRRGQLRLVNTAVLDDEQVFARALGDETVDVEQQALVVAVVERLLACEDGVGIGARILGAAHRHVHVMARERRGLDADTLLQGLGAEVGAPGPGGDGDVHRRAFRGNAHFLRAVERDRAQVAFSELVRAHHFFVRFDERVLAVGDFHHVDVRRVVQAVDMLVQAEHGGAAHGVVGAYALEYREAIVQRVGEHMGGSRAPGHQLAVVPDVSVAVGHRHCCQLLVQTKWTREMVF